MYRIIVDKLIGTCAGHDSYSVQNAPALRSQHHTLAVENLIHNISFGWCAQRSHTNFALQFQIQEFLFQIAHHYSKYKVRFSVHTYLYLSRSAVIYYII